MDDITLGKTFREIVDVAFGGERYHFGFSKKHRSSSDAPLVTIAVRNVHAFQLDDETITYDGIYQWLQDNGALIEVEGDSIYYIIPKYNLELSVDVDDIGFAEVLIYADSEKEEREHDLLPYAEFMALKKSEISLEAAEFTPFVSVSEYEFGIPLELFSIRHRINAAVHNEDGRVYVWVDAIGFRFDDNRLTEILLDRGKRGDRVYMKNLPLMERRVVEQLLAEHSPIERDEHYLFNDIGLAISKNYMKYYFFDRALMPLWNDLERPMSEW